MKVKKGIAPKKEWDFYTRGKLLGRFVHFVYEIREDHILLFDMMAHEITEPKNVFVVFKI